MAFESGTANDHVDLWNKLKSFLKTNPTLVAGGQAWTEVWSAPTGAENETDCVMMGPGMGGTDQIYVGMRRIDRPDFSSFAISLVGMTGVNPSAQNYEDHVNTLTRPCGCFIDSNPMQYWFVANGRRFIAVVKIATVYETLYGGLFLPYADPVSYSYPLFIGGTVGRGVLNNMNTYNYTSAGSAHGVFLDGYTGNDNIEGYCQGMLLNPAANWLQVASSEYYHSSYANGIDIVCSIYPFYPRNAMDIITSTSAIYPSSVPNIINRTVQCFGGGYALTPATIIQGRPSLQTLGILDGIFHVPSEGNAAENIVTVNGVDHLVVQDTFRTGDDNLFAVALE